MNKRNLRRAVAVVSAAIAFAAVAWMSYADDSAGFKPESTFKSEPRGNAGMGPRDMKMPQFFRSDLTDAEKVKVKIIMETFRSSVMDAIKNGEDVGLSVRNAKSVMYADITPYLAEGMAQELEKFAEARIAEMSEMAKNPKPTKSEDGNAMQGTSEEKRPSMDERRDRRTDAMANGAIGPMKKLSASRMPEKTLASINKKLDAIPEEKQEAAFKAIIEKVDAAIAKTSNPARKKLYTAVREIVQERLDSLGDESALEELLGN